MRSCPCAAPLPSHTPDTARGEFGDQTWRVLTPHSGICTWTLSRITSRTSASVIPVCFHTFIHCSHRLPASVPTGWRVAVIWLLSCSSSVTWSKSHVTSCPPSLYCSAHALNRSSFMSAITVISVAARFPDLMRLTSKCDLSQVSSVAWMPVARSRAMACFLLSAGIPWKRACASSHRCHSSLSFS